MATHELKIKPRHFADVAGGFKRAEIRKDDRRFRPGDVLHLREWRPILGYSGRSVAVGVTHALTRADGLAPGYVVLSIERLP